MDLNPSDGRPGLSSSSFWSRPVSSVTAAVVGLCCALCCVGYLFIALAQRDWTEEQEAPPDSTTQPKIELFKGWPQPDLALVLTGQQYGYHQPCGCSHPQYGGLARRFNFLTALKQKGWPVLAVDLGDVADEIKRRNPQSLLKYNTSLEALKLMNYTAVGLGINEMSMPLIDGLSGFPLNNPSPRIVAANLLGQAKAGDPFFGMVAPWEIGGGKDSVPRVGVLGWVAPSVEDHVKDPAIKFSTKAGEVLAANLAELAKQKPELIVLLYQGTEKEARKAADWLAYQRKTNPKMPLVHVIMHLNEDAEPAGMLHKAGDSLLVGIGHKGKYVGVLGVKRKKGNQPYEFQYQLVSMGPEYDTPANAAKATANPVMDLMESYALDLKNQRLFTKFPRSKHPTQLAFPDADFAGSDSCKACHPHAFNIWDKSGHSHAFDTLVKAERPKNREFDGECIVCHTVGFKYEHGFEDAVATPHLKNVGCESCHGPAGKHVAQPRNKAFYPLINPWKVVPEAHRMNRIDQFCQSCHDIDNDVHWNFQKTWPKVIHTTPAAQAQVQPAEVKLK